MSPCRPLAGLLSLCFALVGCQAQRDAEFQLNKCQTERQELQRALDLERARSAALSEQLTGSRRELEAAKAEIAAGKTHMERLAEISQSRAALLEERAAAPLERPDVPLSPLPAALDARLAEFADANSGRVTYDRGRGGVSFANDRLFDLGSDEIRAEALPPLQALAGVLAGDAPPDYEVVVVGHTDDARISRPETLAKHPTNWHLSVHRAIAVMDALVKAGLPASRVGVMGYGEMRPLGVESDRNRRVEVFVVRRGSVQPLEPIRPGRR